MNFSDTNHKKTLSSFSISSTNIRSLCMMDKTKRMRKLLAIRNLDSDISIIIDSQMDERDESCLYKAHRMIMSEYKTVSNYKKPRGVTILIKKKTGITLGNIEIVDENIIILSILTASNETVDIAAIYGPSDRDDPEFFEKVSDKLDSRGYKHRIIVGDWNTTLNANNDLLNYVTDPHKKSREVLQSWEDSEMLFDAFRYKNPDHKEYTWRVRNSNKASRLDMVWATGSLLDHMEVSHVDNHPDVTDHASLKITIDLEMQREGPGLFRCKIGIQNNGLYQSKIKNCIKNEIFNSMVPNAKNNLEYALFKTRVSLEEELNRLLEANIEHQKVTSLRFQIALLMSSEATEDELLQRQLSCSKVVLHEKVLNSIKNTTIKFTKQLKTVTNSNLHSMRVKLGELRNANANGINEEAIAIAENEIAQVETEWIKNQLSNDKNYSLLEDEKPTKRFLNMESGKGGYSNITLLRTKNPHFDPNNPGNAVEFFNLTTGQCIRGQVRIDFQKIYKSQENIKSSPEDLENFLNSDEDTSPMTHLKLRRLPDHQASRLEGEIREEELKYCLFNKMKGGSAPGIDGFTVSWLRQFWFELGPLTTMAINECYREGELSSTLKTAIVKLLRKGTKDPTLTTNYRPISLLSIHYKLASCAITQRIKPHMANLIGRQQKAYVDNNVIGSCIINLISMIKHVNEKKLNALILLIDFKKAFDSIDHKFITTALKAYNFGEGIIKWIQLFFNQREAYIMLGGHLTAKIILEQGVPQGDVISPYIFILMVEILLIKINYTKNLKGITFATMESRSETFADDTTIIVERSEEYLRTAIHYINSFHKLSGLQCNIEKTMVIPVGEINDPQQKLCEDINLDWADEFRILGFNIDNKLERLHTNIEICTRKVRAIINIWRKYNLTINGRMTVAKALLLSQYTYVATVLDLSQKESEYIQSILDNFILYNSFLNHGHKSRYWINQDILYGNKNLGGFNAIRFSDFLLSLKTSWIHRYAVTKVCDHWCDKLDEMLGVNSITRGDLLHWGSAKWQHVLEKNYPILSNFLQAYKIFNQNFVQGVSDKENRWIEQPLFYNPNILNGRKTELRPNDYNIPDTRVVSKLKIIDIFRNLKIMPMEDLIHLGLINLNFLSYKRLITDVNSNIGIGKKYHGVPKLVELRYEGTKPFHLIGTIPEYFKKVVRGSNMFRTVIKERHPKRDLTNINRFRIKLDADPQKQQIVTALKHCHSRIIPKDDIDYKIRAILGKTQFNASLLHWNRAVTSSACYRCGIKEDFKHACFLCPEALSLYTSIYQTLELTPNITITNMLLGHQRPCYIGDQKMRNEELDIIDLVSTMTLGHILKARSSNTALSPPSLLISIKGQMSVIKDKMPKYKTVLDNILARENDPG